MSDLPRHGVTRSARLARLPAGYAGRTALGTGKRLGGRPAELVTQEIQQRTAAQVFTVLGGLKGGALMPGLDAKPLLAELRAKVAEELDYRLEATAQQAFAAAYAGNPDVCVPRVVSVSDHVLVSEWLDGIPLASIIADGTTAQRNRAGSVRAPSWARTDNAGTDNRTDNMVVRAVEGHHG